LSFYSNIAVPSIKLLANDKSPLIGSENLLKRLQKRHFQTMTDDIIIENQKVDERIRTIYGDEFNLKFYETTN
jgi:hypothetical protein